MTTKKMIRAILALTLIAALLCGCGAAAPEAEVPAEAPQVQVETEPPAEATEPMILELPQAVTLTEAGESIALYDGDIALESIHWSCADETVATVTGGVVTALQRGQTTVTATYEDQSVTCAIDCDLPFPMILDENAGERDPMYLPPDVEIVDDAFFDDAVFISDSQGLIFFNCVKYAGLVDNAVHLCRNSYGVESAATNKMLLSWRGQNYHIEDAIAKTEANRVFFMLGINDVGHYGVDQMDQLMEMWVTIIDRIRAKTPHVEICLQSLIPVWTGGETEEVNNEVVRAYNQALKELAKEKDCVFIDVAAYFVDSTGGLASPYTNDNFVHTNAAGVDTWVKVLKACTAYGD